MQVESGSPHSSRHLDMDSFEEHLLVFGNEDVTQADHDGQAAKNHSLSLESKPETNNETQQILEDTQRIDLNGVTNDETRRISHAATSSSETVPTETPSGDYTQLKDTQLITDTQTINVTAPTTDDTLNFAGTQRIEVSNPVLSLENLQRVELSSDTQVIRPNGNGNRAFLSSNQVDTQVIPVLLETDTIAEELSEIDMLQSHRQVINTQDQSETVIKSSQRTFLEEVVTDDEREMLDIPYEDSLLTAKLKKRKQIAGTSPRKRTAKRQQELMTPLHPIPVVFASPSEVGDSSPVNNLLLPSRSSPTQLASIRSDHDAQNINPPSSPESLYQKEIFATKRDGESSELEDVDETQRTNITTKRKAKYIVDTQSQPTETLSEPLQSTNNTVPDTIFRQEQLEILTEDSIRYQTSVWAAYNLKMYTGTVVKQGYEQLTVEFSEGLSEIKNLDLYLLDIRIGDVIRVRTSTVKFIVTGLSSDSGPSIQCMRGYNVVHAKRQSTKTKEFEEVKVPLADCFMELSDWVLHQQTYGLIFKDTDILKQNVKNNFTESILQPVERLGPFSSPVVPRSSRNSPRKLLTLDTGKVFSGKLFCITSIDGERKDEIKNLIESNGGVLLNDGFSELFEYSTTSNGNLLLQSKGLESVTFAAMISNNHCRSAKYLEALALGWPILSEAYIVDCVRDSSKTETWPIYLLPAGQSKTLNCVRSLDVYKFRLNYENQKSLELQYELNSHLLQKHNIIVLNELSGTNSTTLETCKFIFYAFGARSLTYCKTSKEVKSKIEHLEGDILVYDESNTMLAAQPERIRPRSRRNRINQRLYASSESVVGVIDWEWVVQCVISGHIWEPPMITIR